MRKLEYSVHAYAWTPSWDNSQLDLIDRTKSLGFDAIEVPLMEIDKIDPVRIRQRLEKTGLGVLTSTACSERNDPTSDDQNVRKDAFEYLKRCVKATAEMGATIFSGVTYSAIGARIEGFPYDYHWKRAAEILKETAQYAAPLGITVGIEPINRYETFLINTCEQGLKLIEMIHEPNVAIHLDAYHMNIEECDFYKPTLKAVPNLCHFHLSESHRGTVGTGLVNWEGIYRAFADGGYEGMVGLESFIQVSPAMAAATCIWRRLADSTDESLSQGLEYLRKLERECYS